LRLVWKSTRQLATKEPQEVNKHKTQKRGWVLARALLCL
jgi:hypothetical protein